MEQSLAAIRQIEHTFSNLWLLLVLGKILWTYWLSEVGPDGKLGCLRKDDGNGNHNATKQSL